MLAKRVAPSLPPLITLSLAGYLYENGMYTANILIGIAGLSIAIAMTFLIKEVGGSARKDLRTALRWLANLVSKDRVLLVLVLTLRAIPKPIASLRTRYEHLPLSTPP